MTTAWWLAGLMMAVMVPPAMAATELEDLDARMTEATARLDQLQAKIETARARHAVSDRAMRDSVRALVKVRQFPEGLWLVRSVMMDTPMQADVVRVVGQQQAQVLSRAQVETRSLADLYGRANAQLQDLRDIQVAYGEARGRLLAVEKAVLRRAGIQADALSEDLQQALEKGVDFHTVAPARATVGGAAEAAAGGLPVAGRVVRPFGAEGATRAGVVLKAAPGAPVRATQAAKVLYAGPFRHFGGLVIVKTVRGEDVLLGGMDTLHVNAGDDVGVGQQIGAVGRDGRVYWEVRRRGKVVNPL